MKVGYLSGKPPVHFLREGRVFVKCPKPCFDMPYAYHVVKGGKGAHEDDVVVSPCTRTMSGLIGENPVKPLQGMCCYLGQGLPFLHYIKVKIRLEIEYLKHLISICLCCAVTHT